MPHLTEGATVPIQTSRVYREEGGAVKEGVTMTLTQLRLTQVFLISYQGDPGTKKANENGIRGRRKQFR